MDAEVDVDNRSLDLVPGMYASAVIKIDRREKALTLPTQAVSRTGTPTVLLINANQELEERKVSLGLETASRVQILTGLQENDLVMIGSRTQVKLGQKVQPKITTISSE
jgi:multidrug efflux pump subunit AcrA (membrane-fusion protein)